MNSKCYLIITIMVCMLFCACQNQNGDTHLEQKLMTKVKKDASYIAHLEAIYGLAFTNSHENIITSTDFYIRKDQAKVFYGYALGKLKIKVIHEGNQKILFVKLPQPKEVSIDRHVVSLDMTHKDYRPVDEEENPIDVDAWIMQKLKEAVQKYEEKMISMTQTISQEYFETLAHRFGMKLKLEFTDQISKRNSEEEK